MPHERCNRDAVVALDKFTSPKTVTHGVTEHLLAQPFGKSMEAVADCVLRPRRSPVIEEQLPAAGLIGQKAFDDVQRFALQVDDSLVALALRFYSGKYNALLIKLNMTRLDMPNLLRSAAGQPHKGNERAEWIVWGKQREDVIKINRRHVSLTTFGLRLFDLLKRGGLYIAHFLGPIIDTLHGHDSAALVGVAPGGLAIRPFNYMERLERHSIKLGDAGICQKVVEIICVPFKSAGRFMLGTPGRILVEEFVDCNHLPANTTAGGNFKSEMHRSERKLI